MGLTKYKLGELIELVLETNSELQYGPDDVRGMTITKEIIFTKADVTGTDLSKFLVVSPGEFIYNPRTHGKRIGFGYNNTDDTFIISWNNIAFKVKTSMKDVVLADYLFLHFKRDEWDRGACFQSWGSSTEVFSWETLCDMEVDLPPLSIQQKYVDVYNAMLVNQQSYERGLENLRLICDGHFDEAKRGRCISLGEIIEKVDARNSAGLYDESAVRGITNKKQFEDTKANLAGTDLSKFKIIGKGEFAYNSRTDGRDMLVLALNRATDNLIVTFNYNAFRVKSTFKDSVNVEYLYSFFKRSEFDRRVRFDSWGSSQELLSWDSLCEIAVPFPDIEVQNSIAEINTVCIKRKNINEKLKAQIKDICPVLIKGSIEEARKAEEA